MFGVAHCFFPIWHCVCVCVYKDTVTVAGVEEDADQTCMNSDTDCRCSDTPAIPAEESNKDSAPPCIMCLFLCLL